VQTVDRAASRAWECYVDTNDRRWSPDLVAGVSVAAVAKPVHADHVDDEAAVRSPSSDHSS
jgi:hypothetical protein